MARLNPTIVLTIILVTLGSITWAICATIRWIDAAITNFFVATEIRQTTMNRSQTAVARFITKDGGATTSTVIHIQVRPNGGPFQLVAVADRSDVKLVFIRWLDDKTLEVTTPEARWFKKDRLVWIKGVGNVLVRYDTP